jgi:hypothetical protein
MNAYEFEHVTTDAIVATYESVIGVFAALLHEVRELSKKKPDATMSSSKVKLINNVLDDLLTFLKPEPEGKYLERLEDADLPQVSDALLMMAQINAALDAFRKRYHQTVGAGYKAKRYWITAELLAVWNTDDGGPSDDGDDDDDA